jgi:hypothetical protein
MIRRVFKRRARPSGFWLLTVAQGGKLLLVTFDNLAKRLRRQRKTARASGSQLDETILDVQ